MNLACWASKNISTNWIFHFTSFNIRLTKEGIERDDLFCRRFLSYNFILSFAEAMEYPKSKKFNSNFRTNWHFAWLININAEKRKRGKGIKRITKKKHFSVMSLTCLEYVPSLLRVLYNVRTHCGDIPKIRNLDHTFRCKHVWRKCY